MFHVEFWQGAALGFASITGLLAAMRAVRTFYFQGIALHGFDIWKWAAVYALVFMLVALREEFRARGYALFTLAAGIGFWPAAVLSAAYFGYSHQGNSGEDWLGLFNAAAFGLLACFLLRRTGISGCRSACMRHSIGARPTSMEWPTVVNSYPVIFLIPVHQVRFGCLEAPSVRREVCSAR